MKVHTLHISTFIIGSIFLLLSIYQAILLRYPHFYTSFALGSWLVLDFIDYKLNRYSILGYFFQHKHRYAFWLFLTTTTVMCFIVDYLWGVHVVGMWEWIHYKPIHFVRMYVVMNASFILGMYELFRVVRTILKNNFHFDDISLIKFQFHDGNRGRFYIYCLLFGIIGLIVPGYVLIFNTTLFIEYAMLFPFVSLILISDSITYLTGGKPIIDDIVHLKKLDFISLIATSLSAAVVTEILNLFGNEWRYVAMPLSSFSIMGIPIAVFIGWIPLVTGSVAIVNMVKHLDYKIVTK